ncbi:flavoprotein [Nocardiopsis suaedae]|uniref:Flavoprotein n=1 Tax=Nocardiopsis suaedae TaxID=3018444 RepID=A0ABT4TWD5_9ACTN|nr:flavoprotein [Nocardiopsis suaedae]MDA2808987.1 flavoprotein [Nocardiopsis suaedae]
MSDERTLYLIVSGASCTDEEPVIDLVGGLRERGWTLTVLSTPTGLRFHDAERIAAVTGEEVRVDFRLPGTGRSLPPADAVLACPLSFNSTNKLAVGIADNFAVALMCEMLGHQVPMVLVPKAGAPLAAHPAYQQHLDFLSALPSVKVLRDPERRLPSWQTVIETVEAAAHG